MDIAMFTPEYVSGLLVDLGISQSKLGRAADINTTCISRFLSGDGSITLPTAQALSRALEIFIDNSDNRAHKLPIKQHAR